MKKIILLAMVAYFLLAPFSYHPDTKLTLRYAALQNGQVWDIYGYLNNHNLDIPDFHYPPAHFWWLKVHYPISKFIGGNGFESWLETGSVQANYDSASLRFNLAAKFPLLVLGLISGYLIYLLVLRNTGNEAKGRLSALIWYFNPVTIYSLVLMGQNDIVAIFLFLLGMCFYANWFVMVTLFGLASAVKSYPIIWGVIYLLATEKKIYKLIAKSIYMFLVYGFILLPWINKSYFIESVMNSGLSQRMLLANLPIGFDKTILIVPMLLLIVGLNVWRKDNKNGLLNGSLAIFQSSLLILGFSHFNPQWLLWCIPFLSIWVGISGLKRIDLLAFLAILGAWFGLTIGFDDRFLTWGIFTPINPDLINFPSLVEYLNNKGISLNVMVNLCQSLLAGVSLWYIGRKIVISKKATKKIVFDNKWFVVPILLLTVILTVLLNVRTENVTNSGKIVKEVVLIEATNSVYKYSVKKDLKYFEISLNNSFHSEDSGVLEFKDENGQSGRKEFSGFNAGPNSWLRVDLPKNIKWGEELTIATSQVIIKDGVLKVNIDENDRWALRFHNKSKSGFGNFLNRLFKLFIN